MKKYRHFKTEGEYVLIGTGRMQAKEWCDEHLESIDMREVALYCRVKDQSLWVRPIEEFMDGRFTEIGHVEDSIFVLWLFREFILRNVLQWRLGANTHHPMWTMIATVLEGHPFEHMNAVGANWRFIQSQNRTSIEDLRLEDES